jgi:hypothetical protein
MIEAIKLGVAVFVGAIVGVTLGYVLAEVFFL